MEAWLGHPAPDIPPRAFFADYAGLATLEVSRRALRAIEVPVTVLPGPRAEPHVVLAARRLAELLPHGRYDERTRRPARSPRCCPPRLAPMPPTPQQRRRQERLERVIGLAAPALDAVLWVGDRVARTVQRDDPGYDPPRAPAPDSIVRGGARSDGG